MGMERFLFQTFMLNQHQEKIKKEKIYFFFPKKMDSWEAQFGKHWSHHLKSLPLADKFDSEQCHQLAAGDSSCSTWAPAAMAGTEQVRGFPQDRDAQTQPTADVFPLQVEPPIGQDPSEGAVCFAMLSHIDCLDLL